MTDAATRLRVGIDTRLAPCAPEVLYTLGALCDIAGYARDVRWLAAGAAAGERLDLYYGPAPEASGARVAIGWSGRDLRSAPELEVASLVEEGGAPWVAFGPEAAQAPAPRGDGWLVPGDLVLAAFWWLSGAREHAYARDRVDNFDLRGAALVERRLIERPVVSLWARLLRAQLEAQGLRAAQPSWSERGGSALSLSHDVDYPEILRLVEWARAPLRGAVGLASLPHLLRRDAFWRFAEWADFAETLGGHSCFYFMARKGSLLRYLRGDPDAFYDVRAPQFRRVIAELRARGCEIGLHASFRSSEEPERFAAEKARIEEAAGAPIAGNRSHYWRLDPLRPHETLRQLERAGFAYDSTLAYELYPGFRRGVCHPYAPWHREERRALGIVEVPPTWMDDQYDGRLAQNGIADPLAHARGLMDAVQRAGGVTVLDYHVRGMSPVFPRWGAWLKSWLRAAMQPHVTATSMHAIAGAWVAHRRRLAACSHEPLP